MYRERDSNPHGRFGPGDFKSPVSTIPPSRHECLSDVYSFCKVTAFYYDMSMC